MQKLFLDIQTYSRTKASRAGVYRYAESPDFAVRRFTYCVPGERVYTVEPDNDEGEPLALLLPRQVRAALYDPAVLKIAPDAARVRVCLSRALGMEPGTYLAPEGWLCGKHLEAAMGMAADALGDDGRDFGKWVAAVEGVDLERYITPTELATYAADQAVNDCGVAVDLTMVENALEMNEGLRRNMMGELSAITTIKNPTNGTEVQRWAAIVTGRPQLPSPTHITEAEMAFLNRRYPNVWIAYTLRRELAKTSPSKYAAILDAVCADGRLRGMFVMQGAARTGRWSSQLVQLHNLPRTDMPELDGLRRIVRAGTLTLFRSMRPTDGRTALGKLVRTAFVAPPGKELHVCDYNAIEARVLAWLAGEQWMLDAFAAGADLYATVAEQMFGARATVPEYRAGYRARGKVATLALGYGGGAAALEAMGALDPALGLERGMLPDFVRCWRIAHPAIVQLWDNVEVAARGAIVHGKEVAINRGITFRMNGTALEVRLPSGRLLCYAEAKVERDRRTCNAYGNTAITYQTPGGKAGDRAVTYGGKLVENIVQAIARDLLAEALCKCRQLPELAVVMHVHDEVVAEVPAGRSSAALEGIFSTAPAWAKGLPLAASAFATDYYRK